MPVVVPDIDIGAVVIDEPGRSAAAPKQLTVDVASVYFWGEPDAMGPQPAEMEAAPEGAGIDEVENFLAGLAVEEGGLVVRRRRAGGRGGGHDILALPRIIDPGGGTDPADHDLEAETGWEEAAEAIARRHRPRREAAVTLVDQMIERLVVLIKRRVEAWRCRSCRIEMQSQAFAGGIAGEVVPGPVLYDLIDQRDIGRGVNPDERPQPATLQQASWVDALVEKIGDERAIERRRLNRFEDER